LFELHLKKENLVSSKGLKLMVFSELGGYSPISFEKEFLLHWIGLTGAFAWKFIICAFYLMTANGIELLFIFQHEVFQPCLLSNSDC